MRKTLLLAVLSSLLLGLATLAHAQTPIQVIVFKDGRSMRVRSWVRKDQVVQVVDEKGQHSVIRADLVDFERTRIASEAARRTPTPSPTPKREKSLVELSREIQEKRRRAEEPPPPPVATVRVTPRPTSVPVGAAGSPTPDAATSAATTGAAATPEPPLPTPEPAGTPASATPAVPAATPPVVPALPPGGGGSPLLLYGGIGLGVLVVVGGGAFFLMRRKPAAVKVQPAAARAAAPAAAPAEEELLTPAFADDASAEDLPEPAEMTDDSFSSPAELAGSTTATKALPEAPPEIASPGILVDGEIQIRINDDVYTCPSLASLRQWVEEGRVIETSEILSPEGSWLMAGTIPDLEAAFERRRESLGY